MTTTDTLHQADLRLAEALQTGRPCGPVRDLIGEDLADAYAVQELGIQRRVEAGARRVGRKVGLTSPAVQKQLGVDQPDFGVLLDQMHVTGDGVVSGPTLIAPRIEAEIAFVLAEDIDDPDPQLVRRAVGHLTPALEIVDSRIQDWNITITDTIADNASSGLYVLGSAQSSLSEFTPAEALMTLTINNRIVSRGTGADCLGDPLNALVWVAQTAARLGRPLRAGEVVLSGALGPMIPFRPGEHVRATVAGLGIVDAVLN
ncbi:2-keto-4-pentenoate hydratase [Dietzia cercidiphylli]|uniref:Fumarylacetoacetate hydrolase family protein n=2 Tax=Mycobacteriales TaxID=85007 RepID=A0ABP4V8C6_9ACTN|nr:fumarylacetoacetate hydrolase family protein [Dietzia cercidiphylli]MBB1048807.1 2-keto-4-pentenoate hydratase [Dietzia cercidiphylli]BAD51805.1 putative 2-hydroxypenta-2,4-dienoate hydratase [Rhodococcus sp. DFA3]